jgi:sugar/nucleoside kinase (ribokinase family)
MVVGDVIEDIIVIAPAKREDNTDNSSQISAKPGGSGANFAVWLASLGISTELTARVSTSDLTRLATYFNTVGVAPNLQGDQQLGTGRIIVLVEGNSRTFFTDRGANQNLSVDELNLAGFDVLYISGYSVLSLGLEKTKKLIDLASSAGCLVAVDPGSASFISKFGVSEFLSAISGADIIFPNEQEYDLLSQSTDISQAFPEVVITRGEGGAEVLGVASVPAETVGVVDPTGAGDAFAAKYLAMRLQGEKMESALVEANRFAAAAVTKPGGQP